MNCLLAENCFIKLVLARDLVCIRRQARALAQLGLVLPRVGDHRMPGHQNGDKHVQGCHTLLGKYRGELGASYYLWTQDGYSSVRWAGTFPMDTTAIPRR